MDDLWLEVLGVLVCVILSALYSGSETALASLGTTGGHKLLESDPQKNRAIQLWVEHPNRSLTAILVGNTLVSITATALATHTSQQLFSAYDGGTALAVAIGVMTFLLLTFGEFTPKIVARAFASRLAVPAMRFVVISYYLFWPLTTLFVRVARAGLRATGQELGAHQPVTEADIELMVSLGKREGSLTADKERILHSVFEISETSVKEVMVPRVDVIAVEETATYESLMQTAVECGHSRIPVYRETIDQIVGVFYAKDVLKFLVGGGNPADFRIADFTRPPVYVPLSKKVDGLLTEFRQRRIHIAIAVDEFGGTAGLVTLEDIIEVFFGDIQDEYDREEPMLRLGSDGKVQADARVTLDELTSELGLTFPVEHDYESLGGFLTERFGSVPVAGRELLHGGYRFTIVESEPTHVVSVRLEPTTAIHTAMDEPGPAEEAVQAEAPPNPRSPVSV